MSFGARPVPGLAMTYLPPETDALLARAAELRAAGKPWDAVAERLDADPDDLKALAREHTRRFRQLVSVVRNDLPRPRRVMLASSRRPHHVERHHA